MKAWYIVAIFMIALMIGCTQEAQPEEPEDLPPAAPPAEEPPAAPPAEEPPAAPPATETAPTDAEEPAEEKQMMTADEEAIERLKTSCGNGAKNLCIVLKTRYGIEMEPTSAEPADTEDSAME